MLGSELCIICPYCVCLYMQNSCMFNKEDVSNHARIAMRSIEQFHQQEGRKIPHLNLTAWLFKNRCAFGMCFGWVSGARLVVSSNLSATTGSYQLRTKQLLEDLRRLLDDKS